MLLPNRAIFLLFFLQVSIICFILYTLEAKVASIILLFLQEANISLKFSSTTDSLSEVPDDKALVESLIRTATPLSPILAILCKLDIGPIGVMSNLKSPVITITPLGVSIASP